MNQITDSQIISFVNYFTDDGNEVKKHVIIMFLTQLFLSAFLMIPGIFLYDADKKYSYIYSAILIVCVILQLLASIIVRSKNMEFKAKILIYKLITCTNYFISFISASVVLSFLSSGKFHIALLLVAFSFVTAAVYIVIIINNIKNNRYSNVKATDKKLVMSYALMGTPIGWVIAKSFGNVSDNEFLFGVLTVISTLVGMLAEIAIVFLIALILY